MTTLHIEAKCHFCKNTIKFSADESDVFVFNLPNDDSIEKIFFKCENCDKENFFELSLKQIRERKRWKYE